MTFVETLIHFCSRLYDFDRWKSYCQNICQCHGDWQHPSITSGSWLQLLLFCVSWSCPMPNQATSHSVELTWYFEAISQQKSLVVGKFDTKQVYPYGWKCSNCIFVLFEATRLAKSSGTDLTKEGWKTLEFVTIVWILLIDRAVTTKANGELTAGV